MNLVVLCTVPGEEIAKKIAHVLVQESLAACVNIVPGLTSVYSWEGQMVEDSELLLLIKTRQERYPALEQRIRQLHPYQVPEVIALPIQQGSPQYLEWLASSVGGGG